MAQLKVVDCIYKLEQLATPLANSSVKFNIDPEGNIKYSVRLECSLTSDTETAHVQVHALQKLVKIVNELTYLDKCNESTQHVYGKVGPSFSLIVTTIE